MSFNFGPVASCHENVVCADAELTQVSLKKESHSLHCQGSLLFAATSSSQLWTVPEAGLKKFLTNVTQQTFIQSLFSLRQFVGILGHPKANKSKPPLTRRCDCLE